MTLETATKILTDRENFANATPYEQALYTVLRDLQARVCRPDFGPMTEQFRQAWMSRHNLNFHPVAMTMIWPRVGGEDEQA